MTRYLPETSSGFRRVVVQPARAVSATSSSSEAATSDLLARAAVARLYAHAVTMTLAGAVVALCLWPPLYWPARSTAVLAWAVVIHAMQIGDARATRRVQERRRRASRGDAWQRRYRIALTSTALGWGLASVLFIPPPIRPDAAWVALVVVGMAAGGIVANATDRTCIFLWVVPVAMPLPLVLLWHGGEANLLLAPSRSPRRRSSCAWRWPRTTCSARPCGRSSRTRPWSSDCTGRWS